MNEPILQAAVFAALAEDYCAELSSAGAEHTFSRGFEKKMRRLIRRRRKPYYPLISTAMRRAACLLVMIGAGLILSFKGVVYAADRFADDFLIIKSNRRVMVFSQKDTDSPAALETLYEPTSVPAEYELVNRNILDGSLYMDYRSEDNEIIFKQYVKRDFIMNDREEIMQFDRVDIDGHKALLHTGEGFSELYWDNNDYIITMYATLGKDELIKLAKSVRIAENQDAR